MYEKVNVLRPVSDVSRAGEWRETLSEFQRLVRESGKPVRAVAAQLGMSHGALHRILTGETQEPHPSTKTKIRTWVRLRQEGEDTSHIGQIESELERAGGLELTAGQTPEEELLEYFMAHHDKMATFMSTTTEGLNAEDRRKVALAILNAFKKMAIESGQAIPQKIYELEQRFVSE